MSLFNRLFRAEEPTRLSEVSQKVQKMLANDRREFDLAMSALLGEAAWEDVWGELRSLDREVNRLEREIRRHLLVHASVYGAIETPAVLVYMSIVKDIERVGDYAKNLLDLARDGASFQGLPSEELWREFWWEGVSTFMGDAAEAFRAWDGETARRLLSQGDEFLSHADKRVSTIVRGDDQWEQQVARALALRYLKRVVAHIMNLLTALVMPLDQLDFFDEDPEDRSDRMGRA